MYIDQAFDLELKTINAIHLRIFTWRNAAATAAAAIKRKPLTGNV